MTEADLSLLERWLAADHVIPWWGPAPTGEQVAAHYLPYIRHEQPVDAYLIVVDGAPVGYLQVFRVSDWPAFWPQGQPYTSEPDATGIDLLLGEKELVGHGLGTLVIRQFVNDVVFANPEVFGVLYRPWGRQPFVARGLQKSRLRGPRPDWCPRRCDASSAAATRP